MKKMISFFVLLAFVLSCIIPPQGFAQSLSAVGLMPQPGIAVPLSGAFTPAILKGMVIDPNDPFKFDFIIYSGDEPLSDAQKQDEYKKLAKYFLASLAVPEADQWVNLSPYEKDRIVPDNFGLTEMGRDLLAQDYLLKQISSSLTNPDTDLGKKFWDGVYAQAYERFGTTEIVADTFNKVWITPDKAVVYEQGNTVYVLENHLKVMMEKDYLATKENKQGMTTTEDDEATAISHQVMKDIIIPAIEKEVNEGKNFAPLRQVTSGMILSAWYKKALKESILGKLYADKSKVKGIDQDPGNNQEIYGQYVEAFKKGVFNMIKEDVDAYTKEVIPRKYFSGGFKSQYVDMQVLEKDKNVRDAIRGAVNNGTVKYDRAEIKVVDEELSLNEPDLLNDLEWRQQVWVDWKTIKLLVSIKERLLRVINTSEKKWASKHPYYLKSTEITKINTMLENVVGVSEDVMDKLSALQQLAQYVYFIDREPPDTERVKLVEISLNKIVLDQLKSDIEKQWQALPKGFGSKGPSGKVSAKEEGKVVSAKSGPTREEERAKQIEKWAEQRKAQAAKKARAKEERAKMKTLDVVINVGKDGEFILAPNPGSSVENAQSDKVARGIDAAENLGGIDMNAASLDMQIRRDGKGIVLPISQQNLENIRIDGLVPVILNIQPAANVPLFAEADEGVLATAV